MLTKPVNYAFPYQIQNTAIKPQQVYNKESTYRTFHNNTLAPTSHSQRYTTYHLQALKHSLHNIIILHACTNKQIKPKYTLERVTITQGYKSSSLIANNN
eukprot:gene2808-1793_t